VAEAPRDSLFGVSVEDASHMKKNNNHDGEQDAKEMARSSVSKEAEPRARRFLDSEVTAWIDVQLAVSERIGSLSRLCTDPFTDLEVDAEAVFGWSSPMYGSSNPPSSPFVDLSETIRRLVSEYELEAAKEATEAKESKESNTSNKARKPGNRGGTSCVDGRVVIARDGRRPLDSERRPDMPRA